MGLLWDLIQQCQISNQRSDLDLHSRVSADRSDVLSDRIAELDEQLKETRSILDRLIVVLEQRMGEDLNRDGFVGG